MFILWIKRRKCGKKNISDKDKKLLFQDHDDDMKEFRASHPDTDITDVDDILATDGNSLVPVHKVRLTENIQN